VHRFNAQGGLINIKPPGRPSRLSDEQKEELCKLVEAGPDPQKDGVARWRCVDLFQSPALIAATARTAVISAATSLITAGGIEDREVLANHGMPPRPSAGRSADRRVTVSFLAASALIKLASIENPSPATCPVAMHLP
jgi:hypothetical protein